MSADFPDVVTHYSRGEPFRSITAAEPEEWPAIVAGFTDANVWGRDRFADPDYLPRRRVVEAQLRAAFIAAEGEPRLAHPAYAIVGRSARWEAQRTPGMRAYTVALADLPSSAISFTFGDSLLTWHPENRALAESLGRAFHPLAGRLYRLEEVREMAARAPDLHLHLEAQIWVVPAPACPRT